MNTISVVIPVYRGAETIPALVAELAPFTNDCVTAGGRTFRVAEVILVWDRGPDESDGVIRRLAAQHDWIRPVWLARNSGQHAATLAGISSSGGKWIVTMDEDGQHDPAAIPDMLDVAFDERAQLVYAAPTNPPPHGVVRNGASKVAKGVFRTLLSDGRMPPFHSFRLVLGEVARSIAAFTGPGIYFDVALSWVVGTSATCPVAMRDEGRPAGTYSYPRLFEHFARLVLSSGTRPLRLVTALGAFFGVAGLALAIVVVVARIFGDVPVQGWTSVVVAVLIVGGITLLSLGVIAEYLGVAVKAAMGRPLYTLSSDPNEVFAEADAPAGR